MAKESTAELLRIKAAIERYLAAVEDSNLKESTKNKTALEIRQFVRWLEDDYHPGQGVRSN